MATAATAAIPQTHHELYETLAAIVGPKFVTDDYFALIPYARDISYFKGVMPGIAVRPGSTEEVSEIMKVANRTGYPVLIKGGGQSGGGVTKGEPRRNIMLDMGRIDFVKPDIDNLKVKVGGGARLSTIDDALRPYGYYINTVIGPYYTVTAGGLVGSTGGAGFGKNVASVGCNWTYVLGLKVVLPTGEIITTGAGPDQNIFRDEIFFREGTGPDLTDIFVSSGGALGIITEVMFRIIPIPKHMKAVCYVTNTMESTWDIQLELSKQSRPPYSNTIMFELTNYMVAAIAQGMEGYGAIFYAVEGDNEAEIDIRLGEIKTVCEKHGAVRGNKAMDAFALNGTTGTMEIVRNMNANSCPFMTWESLYTRTGSLEYTKGLRAAFNSVPDHDKYETAAGFYLVPMGHIFLTGVTLRSRQTTTEAEAHLRESWLAGAEYMRKIGTSATYAQGTNSCFVADTWSPAQTKVMGAIKKTLDPNNILNPGLWNL
jgi:glycolate oxidase